jgi:uncharacterized membrane protein
MDLIDLLERHIDYRIEKHEQEKKKVNLGEYSIKIDVDTDNLVRKLDVIRHAIEFVVDELEEIDAEDKFIDDVL